MVKVCKARSINFVLLCKANIDMAMEQLHAKRKILPRATKPGNFKDGSYFKLTNAERGAVDKVAEETCLATIFLSLSCDELHYNSKQELKNDMVKGENKYPRTIATTLHFLQYHNRKTVSNSRNRGNNNNLLLAQDGDDSKSKDKDKMGNQT